MWLFVGGLIGLLMGVVLAFLLDRFLLPHHTLASIRSRQVGWRGLVLVLVRRGWQACWWAGLVVGLMTTGLIWASAHAVKSSVKKTHVLTYLGEKAALPLVHASWKRWAPERLRGAGLDTPLDVQILTTSLAQLLEASPESLAHMHTSVGDLSPAQAWWLSHAIRWVVKQKSEQAELTQKIMEDIRQHARPGSDANHHLAISLRETSVVFSRRIIDPMAAGWLSGLIWSQSVPVLVTLGVTLICPLLIFWSIMLYRYWKYPSERPAILHRLLGSNA